MMKANFTIKMDKQGVFTGVVVGSGKDAKTFTVEAWNKMMTDRSAVKTKSDETSN